MVCRTAGVGAAEEIGASVEPDPGLGDPDDTTDTCRCEGLVRLQLQQQKGKTIHHGSRVVMHMGGVTVQQASDALDDIYNDPSVSIPHSLDRAARDTLERAIAFLRGLPPYGVPQGWKKSFYFDEQDPKHSWRWDVESLYGQQNFQN